MSSTCSPFIRALRRFARDSIALIGAAGIVLLLIPAVYAPFIANGRPLLLISDSGEWSMPFVRFIFSPESSEVTVEKLFNLRYSNFCQTITAYLSKYPVMASYFLDNI